MLRFSRKTTVIDFDQFFEDLNSLGFIYVNPRILQEHHQEIESLIASLRDELQKMVIASSYCGIMNLSSKSLISYLKNYLGVPAYYLEQKNSKGEFADSLSASKVLKPLMEVAEANNFDDSTTNWSVVYEFADKLITLRSLVSKNGIIKGILDSAVPTDSVDSNGEKLVAVNFNISPRDNLRVYYSDKNIQQVPKIALDAYAAPKGYVIVSGDFSQSDLRIAYSTLLKTQQNINDFMSYSDTYEAFDRVLMGDAFDLEHFTANRKAYKAESLKPLYGGTRAASTTTKDLVASAVKYLASCPLYMENKNRIIRRIEHGLPVRVSSYFGYQQSLERNPRMRSNWKQKLIDKALNAPIQTGTSEAVISVERYILDEFAKLGVTPENGGIYAYICRHDEMVFMIKEEYLTYSHIFQKAQKLQIDDWVPLEVEFHYCRNYGVDDPIYTKVAKGNYLPEIEIENTTYTPGPSPSKPYIPTADFCCVATGVTYFTSHGVKKALVAYLDCNKRKATYRIYDFESYDSLHEFMVAEILTNSDKFVAQDFADVLMYSPLIATEITTYNVILLKETPNFPAQEISLANLAAAYATASYLNQQGEDYTTIYRLVEPHKQTLQQLINWGELL